MNNQNDFTLENFLKEKYDINKDDILVDLISKKENKVEYLISLIKIRGTENNVISNMNYRKIEKKDEALIYLAGVLSSISI